MRITPCFIGKNVKIEPSLDTFVASNLTMSQGSQMLRVPGGSEIRGLRFCGGASHLSNWASLKGAVLKFSVEARPPIRLVGSGFSIPTGYTLMDRGSFKYTLNNKNEGSPFPFRRVSGLSDEDLFLVHSSYCHPENLFLPQGTFLFSSFSTLDPIDFRHMRVGKKALSLNEEEIPLPLPGTSFNILRDIEPPPTRIFVKLKEGGHVLLATSRGALRL